MEVWHGEWAVREVTGELDEIHLDKGPSLGLEVMLLQPDPMPDSYMQIHILLLSLFFFLADGLHNQS